MEQANQEVNKVERKWQWVELVGLAIEIKDIKIAAYPYGKRQRVGELRIFDSSSRRLKRTLYRLLLPRISGPALLQGSDWPKKCQAVQGWAVIGRSGMAWCWTGTCSGSVFAELVLWSSIELRCNRLSCYVGFFCAEKLNIVISLGKGL